MNLLKIPSHENNEHTLMQRPAALFGLSNNCPVKQSSELKPFKNVTTILITPPAIILYTRIKCNLCIIMRHKLLTS